MRTLQEKYNAVLEGKFSKEQFRKDAVMQLPNLVSKFNSFEDMTTILKNRGMLAEAAKEMHTSKYAETDTKPEDHISLDLIDAGIRCELDEKFGKTDVSEEDYEKAKATAIKNLSKDPLYYIKKDSDQMPESGEKVEKAKLKEGYLKPAEVLRTITGKKKKVVDRAARTYTWKVLSAEEIQKMIDAKVAEYDSRSTPDEKLDYAVHDVVGGSVESSGPGYAEYSLANANDEQIKLFKKFMDANDEESYDTLLSIRDRVYRDGKEHQPEKSYMKSPDTWKDHAKHLKWDIGDATSKMMGIKETATKVQNALGDIASTVAEKPASVAAAFKKMVLADPVKYAKMSAHELEQEFEKFKLEEATERVPANVKVSVPADYTGPVCIQATYAGNTWVLPSGGGPKEQNLASVEDAMDRLNKNHDHALSNHADAPIRFEIIPAGDKVPASAYPENRHLLTPDELGYDVDEAKALKEGKSIELSAKDMEKLHKDGKITLPDGSVLHFVGKPANEAGDDVNVDKFERKRTNTRDFVSTPKEREDGTYDISGMMKEAQLKEAIKKIIAKVITEEVNESIKEGEKVDLTKSLPKMNKPLMDIGKELDQKLKAAGFQTKIFMGKTDVPKEVYGVIEDNEVAAGIAFAQYTDGTGKKEVLDIVTNGNKLKELEEVLKSFNIPAENGGKPQRFGPNLVQTTIRASVD